MHGKGDFHSDCQSGPRRVKSSFVFPALLLAEKVGSQDSGAGNNFPAQFGDLTNTMEALEELHPRAARGQDLLRNWWDLYVACQKQGAPEKVPASVGKRGAEGEPGKQQRAEGPCFNRGASQPIGKQQLKQ